MTDTMLINLSIISKVSLDDKLYMNNEGYMSIENNTIFQGIFRFVFRNGRNKTISNLNNFYNSVFSYIDNVVPNMPNRKAYNALDDSESNLIGRFDFTVNRDKDYGLKTLMLYLKRSIAGIENLKETYNCDIVMSSKLEIILDNIRLYSDKLEKKINDYV